MCVHQVSEEWLFFCGAGRGDERGRISHTFVGHGTTGVGGGRGEFRPRQTRQLPRAVDLKGRLLSCQSY